jgi:hypothetical protein
MIYKFGKRGLLSELNSLLGLYEEQILTNKSKIYVDSNHSVYFRKFTFYDVFKTNDIFSDQAKDGKSIISQKRARFFASRKYEKQISNLDAAGAFVYQNCIYEEIRSTINNLSLPDSFVCFHIRRGDKVMEKPYEWSSKTGKAESKRFEFSEYLKQVPDVDAIFIMTDDYKCIKEAKEYMSDNSLNYRLIYLTNISQDGHSTELDFLNNRAYTKDELVHFFSEIEIAKLSDCFVGTSSSNVYRYIMNTCTTKTKFISLD